MGVRIVLPSKLQARVQQELHRGHPGEVKMKQLARSYVWWPDIDKHLEELAKSCEACQSHKNAPPCAPLHPWQWPQTPWERIHVDFLGPFLGKMIFVAIDAHSKWPEAQMMTTTTAAKTICVLREIFSRNGIPKQLVSDNGPQFCAEEFRQFMKNNGIEHIRTAPYHPASNGAAERLVQTLKQSLRSSYQTGMTLDQALATFLLKYRTTKHMTTGVAPCMLFCKRKLRTRLDLLVPDLRARVHKEQEKQKDYHDRHSQYRELSPGQLVWARNLRDGPHWVKAVVLDRLGPVSYLVRLEGGELWRRHIDHLRVASESPEREAENEISQQPEVSDPSPGFPPLSEFGTHTNEETPHEHNNQNEAGPTSPSTGSNNELESIRDQSVSHRYPTRTRQPPNRLYGTLDTE